MTCMNSSGTEHVDIYTVYMSAICLLLNSYTTCIIYYYTPCIHIALCLYKYLHWLLYEIIILQIMYHKHALAPYWLADRSSFYLERASAIMVSGRWPDARGMDEVLRDEEGRLRGSSGDRKVLQTESHRTGGPNGE